MFRKNPSRYYNLEKELYYAGIQKKELCRRIGIDESTLYRHLANKSGFTHYEMEKIVEVLAEETDIVFKLDYLFERLQERRTKK